MTNYKYIFVILAAVYSLYTYSQDKAPQEALIYTTQYQAATAIIKFNGLPVTEFIGESGSSQHNGEFVFVNRKNKIDIKVSSGDIDFAIMKVPFGAFPDEAPPLARINNSGSTFITLSGIPEFTWLSGTELTQSDCALATSKVLNYQKLILNAQYSDFIHTIITDDVLASYQTQYPNRDFSSSREELISSFDDFGSYELIRFEREDLECHYSINKKLLEVTLINRAHGFIAEKYFGPLRMPIVFDYVFMKDNGELKLAF